MQCRARVAVMLMAAGILIVPVMRADGMAPSRVVAMKYPVIASHARIEGVVVLQCSLDAEGQVLDVNVLSGHPLLAVPAKQNATRWKFRAITADKSQAQIILVYRFRIENPSPHQAGYEAGGRQ